jgi:hypothetical protein
MGFSTAPVCGQTQWRCMAARLQSNPHGKRRRTVRGATLTSTKVSPSTTQPSSCGRIWVQLLCMFMKIPVSWLEMKSVLYHTVSSKRGRTAGWRWARVTLNGHLQYRFSAESILDRRKVISWARCKWPGVMYCELHVLLFLTTLSARADLDYCLFLHQNVSETNSMDQHSPSREPDSCWAIQAFSLRFVAHQGSSPRSQELATRPLSWARWIQSVFFLPVYLITVSVHVPYGLIQGVLIKNVIFMCAIYATVTPPQDNRKNERKRKETIKKVRAVWADLSSYLNPHSLAPLTN